MKTYKGSRNSGKCKVTVTTGDGVTYDLPPRVDLKAHTVDGSFEWAYNGQGPCQLSLAIAADVTGNDKYALEIYHQLRAFVVSRLPFEKWEMTEPNIREFC